MIFKHNNLTKNSEWFYFDKKVKVKCSFALDKPIIKELWNRFTFNSIKTEWENTSQIIFQIGDAEILQPQNFEYAINVTKSGVSVSAIDEKGLLRGFMTLIDLIEFSLDGQSLKIKSCKIKENPLIKNRMIHFCVFHNTELWQIERFFRFCAVMKYTHVVLEFWGMFKYECLRELSWENAYEKEQLAPIIKQANDLGIEVIPMLNIWGHASAGRLFCGKHVVLDQNLSLQPLFNQSGWCWNYKNPKTLQLLSQMQDELCELCGNGEYFHIGCDEAFDFDFSEKSMFELCEYINSTSNRLSEKGRKTIMWGDMILSKRPEYTVNTYSVNCLNEECERYMQEALNRDVIIADWQYDVIKVPVETAIRLKDKGFNTMLCPWEKTEGVIACCETAISNELFGVLHTTWHTLSSGGYKQVVECAQKCWNEKGISSNALNTFFDITTALRKVYDAKIYEKSGWVKEEVNKSVY